MERSTYENMAAVQRDHWWYRGRREILQSVLADLSLKKEARILEAGCGPGGNIEMLAGFGEVSAFDPDEASVRLSRSSGVATVEVGAFPDRIPFDDSFDVAAAFDVIEHVEDDVAALRALAAQVVPGGYVVVTVPAYKWLWSAHDVRNHHKRRYTRDEVTALFAKAGLRVRRATYFNSLLFPIAAGVRLVETALGRSSSSETIIPPKRVNRLLEKLFASERHLLRMANLPFGVSILVSGQTA